MLLSFSSCQKDEKTTVVIATAANMQYAMNDICEAFTKKTGIKCHLVVASSGKLTAQIEKGAPYDIFVSANLKYPQHVFEKGFALEPPKVYAKGELVLWTMKDTLVPDITSLGNRSIKHIAIANPTTAPYGGAALQALKKLQLDESVKSKLVYGESIAQTNQFIYAQSVDVGFTALSVVLSSKMKNQGQWIKIDTSWYQPIQQGIVVVANKKENQKTAKAFYKFIFSPEATNILEKFGYLTSE